MNLYNTNATNLYAAKKVPQEEQGVIKDKTNRIGYLKIVDFNKHGGTLVAKYYPSVKIRKRRGEVFRDEFIQH